MSTIVACTPDSDLQTARILVVDDDFELRAMVAHQLMRAGYEVSEVSGGSATVDAALAWLPDLVVIVDITPAGQDAFTVRRRLRADPGTARIPVLRLSALSQPDMVRGLRSGSARHLDRPFSPDALVQSVQSLLARRAA